MSGVTAKRVVIAEDEALIRMDLAEMLAEEGYDVVGQAGDGEEAVRLAIEQRPDLVILDVKMPGLTGTDVIKLIRGSSTGGHVKVMFYSSTDTHELRALSEKHGAQGYLTKAASMSELEFRVREVLGDQLRVSRKSPLRSS